MSSVAPDAAAAAADADTVADYKIISWKKRLRILFPCLIKGISRGVESPFLSFLCCLFFFFFFFLLILSFETINKLKLSFECGIPVPQDARTPSLSEPPFPH
jgi:hypothetical protein